MTTTPAQPSVVDTHAWVERSTGFEDARRDPRYRLTYSVSHTVTIPAKDVGALAMYTRQSIGCRPSVGYDICPHVEENIYVCPPS